MKTFRFASLPSHSSVVAGVTTLVSAWFLVAAGTIIADPSSTDAIRVDPPREMRQAVATPDIPEAAREKIVVTARRSARV